MSFPVLSGGGNPNGKMLQFMENDRRVCRFYAVLDDLMTAQYERRPFIILFFLADGSVEIRIHIEPQIFFLPRRTDAMFDGCGPRGVPNPIRRSQNPRRFESKIDVLWRGRSEQRSFFGGKMS